VDIDTLYSSDEGRSVRGNVDDGNGDISDDDDDPFNDGDKNDKNSAFIEENVSFLSFGDDDEYGADADSIRVLSSCDDVIMMIMMSLLYIIDDSTIEESDDDDKPSSLRWHQ